MPSLASLNLVVHPQTARPSTFRARSSRVITLLALAGTMAFAGAPGAAAQDAAPIVQDQLLTIEFAGGTASDYLGALRRALPGVNIVERGPVSRMPVNPISIRGADPFSAVLLLDGARFVHGTEAVRIDVERVSTRADRAPIFVVTAEAMDTERHAIAISRIMSLREIITLGVEVDAALSAVETALALDATAGEPAVRYHEDTALLIVRAHPTQVETIEQVLDQLAHGAQIERSQRERAQRNQQSRARLEEMEVALTELRVQLDATRAERTEWQIRAEASADQVRQLLQALQEATDRSAMLESKVERLERDSGGGR